MEKNEDEVDVCVVGGGVMGSCAAHCLALANKSKSKSIILLEQFPIPHTRGSSSGHSRITSLSDYGPPYMAPLVTHGYKQWIKTLTTAAVLGGRTAPVLTIGTDQEAIKEKGQRVTDAGFPPVWLDIDQVNAKYKSQMPSDRFAVVDPSGMILMPSKCVAAVQKLYLSLGGQIVDGCPVKQIVPQDDGWVRVVCPRNVFRCKSLILCPGPWANNLLTQLGLNLPLKTLKTGIWYYKLNDPTFPRSNINDLSIPNSFYYATPQIEYPGLIKFGIHEGVEVSPEERDRADLTHLKEKMKDYLQKYFPTVEPEPSIEESCMYTMTPDEDFILDYHPKYKNIVYACGFSGRGFQLGPAIGEVLARMALGMDDIHDMTPFKASRFTTSDSSTSSTSASSKI